MNPKLIAGSKNLLNKNLLLPKFKIPNHKRFGIFFKLQLNLLVIRISSFILFDKIPESSIVKTEDILNFIIVSQSFLLFKLSQLKDFLLKACKFKFSLFHLFPIKKKLTKKSLL